MSKLVRDHIPHIIRASGRDPLVHVVDGEDRRVALLSKLGEECSELTAAAPEDVLDEAADLYEVLLSLLAQHGHGRLELELAAAQKRAERGGFEHGVILDAVSDAAVPVAG
ncbi:nucleoside triphosphate pyrophosphohydrolase [Lolliginicoccus suaedae]|uniref:nucleoside triphosphate pyrophosphohydrolase n=1 Tax=Lolliginicoccus suaedae TaxID=2605429 RepID=UPI0011EC2611|nr:nucleoside triphosphate pyrophosphohydrolase [Lolliginicoccus suaedae]